MNQKGSVTSYIPELSETCATVRPYFQNTIYSPAASRVKTCAYFETCPISDIALSSFLRNDKRSCAFLGEHRRNLYPVYLLYWFISYSRRAPRYALVTASTWRNAFLPGLVDRPRFCICIRESNPNRSSFVVAGPGTSVAVSRSAPTST
jgi:hypothetical protein